MKLLSTVTAVMAAILFMLVSGCTSSIKPAGSAKSSQISQLNADEQKGYDEAINAIKSEQDDKAFTILLKITNNHPSHLGAAINLAGIYLRKDKIAEAQTMLQKAKLVNGSAPEVYNLEGLILVASGKYTDAEKSYLSAIRLKEDYPTAHYNLALLYDIYYQDVGNAVIHYERYNELCQGADKKTLGWTEELKQKLKHKGK